MPKPNTVFEISQVVRGKGLHRGYCCGWTIDEGLLVLDQPFSRLDLFVPLGTLCCRGEWTGPKRLSLHDHRVAPCDFADWMDLDGAILIRAIDLAAASSIDLDERGFRRTNL